MLRLCGEDDKPLEAPRSTSKLPAELRTPSPERVAAVVSNVADSALYADGALYAVPSPPPLHQPFTRRCPRGYGVPPK